MFINGACRSWALISKVTNITGALFKFTEMRVSFVRVNIHVSRDFDTFVCIYVLPNFGTQRLFEGQQGFFSMILQSASFLFGRREMKHRKKTHRQKQLQRKIKTCLPTCFETHR